MQKNNSSLKIAIVILFMLLLGSSFYLFSRLEEEIINLTMKEFRTIEEAVKYAI